MQRAQSMVTQKLLAGPFIQRWRSNSRIASHDSAKYARVPRFPELFASLVLLILNFEPAYGQYSFGQQGEPVKIEGTYLYIRDNGAPRTTNTYRFEAVATGSEWQIAVTNANEPREWSIVRSDGVDIRTIGTDGANSYKPFGYAFAGQRFLPDGALDGVKPFFPWMALHLTPQMIKEIQANPRDMAAPWGQRHNVVDYGLKWNVAYSADENAIERIDAVRDSSLDLKTQEEELRRTAVNYPFESFQREHRLNSLERRAEIPNGFVRATYECKAVIETNGWVIPTEASFASYWPNFQHPETPIRLQYQMELHVETILFSRFATVPELISPGKTIVLDYRYEGTNARTKFNYARYEIPLGQAFPGGNDATLLKQRDDWLKHGPSYDVLGRKRFTILIGMLVVAGFPLAFWLISRYQQTRNETKSAVKII